MTPGIVRSGKKGSNETLFLLGDPAGCSFGAAAVADAVGAHIVSGRNLIIVAAVNGKGIRSVYIIGICGGFAGAVHLIPHGAALFPEGDGDADKVFNLLVTLLFCCMCGVSFFKGSDFTDTNQRSGMFCFISECVNHLIVFFWQVNV